MTARWGVECTIEVHDLDGRPDHGYTGIVLAALRRPAEHTTEEAEVLARSSR